METNDERATRQPDEWLLVHVIRRTWWHIDEGWERVPRAQRWRWLVTMCAGFVLLIVVTLVLVVGARAIDQAGLLSWEPQFVEAFERHAPFSFGWAIWIESPGNGVVLWPIVILSAGLAAWSRRTLLALTILLGFVALDAAVLLGWHVWERPRPTLVAGGVASSSESFSAFPSGHVSQTVVVYGMLVALWLRRTTLRAERLFGCLVVLLLVAAVAAGRLRLGAHWPSDIAGGALIGGLWLAVLVRATREQSAHDAGAASDAERPRH